MFKKLKTIMRIPAWEGLRTIGQSRLLSLTIFIPVLGYMIIFNEQLVHLFELSKDIFTEASSASNNALNPISNDTKNRLFYFYFGFTFLGVGSLMYKILCPNIIKVHGSVGEFIREGANLMTHKRFDMLKDYLAQKVHESLFADLNDLKKKFHMAGLKMEDHAKEREQAATDILHLQWQYETLSKPVSRIIIFVLYMLGFLVLAIPSVEMFAMVCLAYAN